MPFLNINFIQWIRICLLLALLVPALQAADSPEEAYQKGNELYEEGKYDQSARLYQKSFQQGHLSEELFYNLGNTFFKQENYGEAALWYRRALILNPRMPEPRQNLRTLKNRVGLLDFEPKGVDQFISHFRESELTSLLTICTWLALLSLATALFVKRLRPWRPLLIAACCLFIGLTFTAILALRTYRKHITVDHRAVITAADAIAQTSPVPDAKTVIELPPGSEVRIVTDSGPWQYIDIPGELRGWVKTENLAPLWPPTPADQETPAQNP
ncbi:MAG: tetratricopeptide repeat protein [Verrucomicrobiota bacterium]